MFDFMRFCEDHRIPYVTHGVNKKVSDDCNISCPFCNATADPDPSHHLGVDSQRQVYSCWRNPRRHRGRTLHRLIMALLRCSYPRAREILGEQPLWLQSEQFELLANNPDKFFSEKTPESDTLKFPKEFQMFQGTRHAEHMFKNYLSQRNFREVDQLTEKYALRWVLSGQYQKRIIIPFYQNFRLVGWTARSIYSKTSTRYLTLAEHEGALINVKKMVFNWDQLITQPTDVVVVCEGPFDAMKVDFYGQPLGVRATCLFSQTATMEQVAYVAALADLYQKIIILLDDTATLLAESLADQLPGLPVEVKTLPVGIHDPGELSMGKLWSLSRGWLK